MTTSPRIDTARRSATGGGTCRPARTGARPGRLAFALMLALLCTVTAGAEQASPQRPPDTDQTVDVARGARLAVSNHAGEVIMRTWERDAVRVVARHSSRTKVHIRNSTHVVGIDSSSRTGVSSVDYEITAPAWMAVKVEGTYNFVSIEGAQSEVSATTVRGDIVVKGGSGFVTAKSIEGVVTVEGATGRIQAESVNEGVRIIGASGDIVAETTNGDISLTRVNAKSVDVGTVNGDLTYEGTLSGGRYRFTTHNGDIRLTVPENSSATFSVRTYNGEFRSNLQLQGGTPAEVRRGRRVSFTLGSGSAQVELESFSGTIRILRPGSGPSRGSPDAARHQSDAGWRGHAFGTLVFGSGQHGPVPARPSGRR